MKVLVTGATGFTGSFVVPELIRAGYDVRCLIRPTSNVNWLPLKKVEKIVGDFEDPQSLVRALTDVDILVNIASIGFGHAPVIVDAAVKAGVQRGLFIGTTAIFTTLNAPSKKVRLAAEETITGSGLDYTIIRPTMIYGTSRDRNMCRLIRYLNRWTFIPVLGGGKNLQQPIYVRDLAVAVKKCLDTDRTIGKAYNVAGAEPLNFNQVIDTVARILKRPGRKIHLPAGPFVVALKALEKILPKAPIKAEQILRLNEDKAFDYSDAERDFDFSSRSFEEGVSSEIEEMRRCGEI